MAVASQHTQDGLMEHVRAEQDAQILQTVREDLRELQPDSIEDKYASASRDQILADFAHVLAGYQAALKLHAAIVEAERTTKSTIAKVVAPPAPVLKASKPSQRIRGLDNMCAVSTTQLRAALEKQRAEDNAKAEAAAVKRQATAAKKVERAKQDEEKKTARRALYVLGFISDRLAVSGTIPIHVYRQFMAKQHPGSTIPIAPGVKRSKAELFEELKAVVLNRLARNDDLVDLNGQAVPADVMRVKLAQSLPADEMHSAAGEAAVEEESDDE